MTTATVTKEVERYAELVAHSKAVAAELKELRETVLDLVPVGDKVATLFGTVSHVATETLITDDDLIGKLKVLGVWARVRKTTVDTSKVRAYAKVHGNVRRLLRFKSGSRIDVR